MKEKMTELINHAFVDQSDRKGIYTAYDTADYLIAHNVTVLPCRPGDKLYVPSTLFDTAIPFVVERVELCQDRVQIIDSYGNVWTVDDIGKNVFLTSREAEAVLR